MSSCLRFWFDFVQYEDRDTFLRLVSCLPQRRPQVELLQHICLIHRPKSYVVSSETMLISTGFPVCFCSGGEGFWVQRDNSLRINYKDCASHASSISYTIDRSLIFVRSIRDCPSLASVILCWQTHFSLMLWEIFMPSAHLLQHYLSLKKPQREESKIVAYSWIFRLSAHSSVSWALWLHSISVITDDATGESFQVIIEEEYRIFTRYRQKSNSPQQINNNKWLWRMLPERRMLSHKTNHPNITKKAKS